MNRLWHHWEQWECAAMYGEAPNGLAADEAREWYAEFLSDLGWFRSALERVLAEWPVACEQFLSNAASNRIAWLGQASACIELGLPAAFRGGFKLLSAERQAAANTLAEEYLQKWLAHAPEGRPERHRGRAPAGTRGRIAWYLEMWGDRGYSAGIPESVPEELMRKRLAPSWRAIALALLQNDLHLTSLGFSAPCSKWYGVIKRAELERRTI